VCGKFPVPSISWTSEANATCPFQSGMCQYGDTAAFEITSKMIDSHFDLGINAPPSMRVQIGKKTTCAPVRTAPEGTAPFFEMKNASNSIYGRDNDIVVEYFYGPILGASNETYWYNDHAKYDSIPYALSSVSSSAGVPPQPGAFVPVPAINTTDADLSLLFIAANSVWYQEPCSDPIFGAHQLNELSGVYYADYWVTPLGCIEQYRVCSPQSNACTPYMGLWQLDATLDTGDADRLGLNTVQQQTFHRLFTALQVSNVYYATFTRLGSALRASETLSGLNQRYLPPNQWHLEVASWFDSGLARLQQIAQEYATGPDVVPSGSFIASPDLTEPTDIIWAGMCHSQLINDASTTMSFSVLGIAILIGLGLIIVLLSFSLDTVIGWLQKKTGKGLHARMEWRLNDKLELQRLLYQEMRQGHWDDSKSVPVTALGDKLSSVAEREMNRLETERSASDNGVGVEMVQQVLIPKREGTPPR